MRNAAVIDGVVHDYELGTTRPATTVCGETHPMKNVKEWKSILVRECVDQGDIRGAIEGALNELSAEGYEPVHVTRVGASDGVMVVVSGWMMKEVE